MKQGGDRSEQIVRQRVGSGARAAALEGHRFQETVSGSTLTNATTNLGRLPAVTPKWVKWWTRAFRRAARTEGTLQESELASYAADTVLSSWPHTENDRPKMTRAQNPKRRKPYARTRKTSQMHDPKPWRQRRKPSRKDAAVGNRRCGHDIHVHGRHSQFGIKRAYKVKREAHQSQRRVWPDRAHFTYRL